MRRLLIFFVILLALGVAGDLALRAWAEARAEVQLQEDLDLARRPTVALGGFPFVFAALDGSFPEVRVETGSVASAGVRLEDVHLVFRDVEVSLGQVLAGRAGAIRSGGGRGEAFLSAADLGEGLPRRARDVQVRFEAGAVYVSAPELPEEVEAELNLRGSRLILAARGAPVRHVVELPHPVEGMEYRTVLVRDDRAVLRFALPGGRLRPPQ